MRLSQDPRLPQIRDFKDFPRLVQSLYDLFRDIAAQVNLISEGAIHGTHNALTAAPTSGSYRQGDYIKNKSPSELGTAGSKYVIKGWVCVASGSPGTWVEDRGWTGN